MVTTLLLAPPYTNRKSHRGKGPNVKTPAIPRYCGDNQKVIALHLSPAIYTPVGGGAVDTNDWCIIFGIEDQKGLRRPCRTEAKGPLAFGKRYDQIGATEFSN